MKFRRSLFKSTRDAIERLVWGDPDFAEVEPAPIVTVHLTPYIAVQGPGMTVERAWAEVLGR